MSYICKILYYYIYEPIEFVQCLYVIVFLQYIQGTHIWQYIFFFPPFHCFIFMSCLLSFFLFFLGSSKIVEYNAFKVYKWTRCWNFSFPSISSFGGLWRWWLWSQLYAFLWLKKILVYNTVIVDIIYTVILLWAINGATWGSLIGKGMNGMFLWTTGELHVIQITTFIIFELLLLCDKMFIFGTSSCWCY